jgi:hypothetical protein
VKSVSSKSRLEVWTRVAGRCQFAGCNRFLLGDALSGKRSLNKAYIAHIVAEEPNGPRGDPVLSPQLVDEPANLMLMCDEHHRLIDREAPNDYSVERLREMKRRHEARIAAVSEIPDDRATHVLLYGAKVGAHDTPVRFDLAQAALLPEAWSTPEMTIHLEMSGVAAADHEDAYWALQAENLRSLFDRRVCERSALGEIRQIAVFALAPQPLLIELGRLLGDIARVSVRQLQREPQDWRWTDGAPLAYQVHQPLAGAGGPVALNISLSATITDDRIHPVLGDDAAIWTLTVPEPNNNMMRSAQDLAAFRIAARRLLDEIKARHGNAALLHVFPAMPVSAAVELGRCWMPKADLPLIIYDQSRQAGGFRPRLTLGAAEVAAPSKLQEPIHG